MALHSIISAIRFGVAEIFASEYFVAMKKISDDKNFEDVNVDYKLLSSNAETEAVRKGLTQIRDWKRWMADNRVYFLESCGLGQISRSIPQWGAHYCLVVSRRSRMSDIANQMRGQTQHETPELHIITYDRLVDNVRKLTNGF